MNRSTRWLAGFACCLLAGCVTTTKDGGKPLKEESQQFQAAKYNVQLGTAYLQQGNYPLAKEKLERALKQNPKVAHGIRICSRKCLRPWGLKRAPRETRSCWRRYST